MNLSETISTLSRILICLILTAAYMYPQEAATPSIYGVVKDSDTGEPIEGANVYIANSLYGTSTDGEGKYSIDDLPPGIYDLIVSHVSYNFTEMEIRVDDNSKFNYDFLLIKQSYELQQMTVEAEVDDDWQDMFEIFFENLVGLTKNAQSTTILNSYVIDLAYTDDGVLTASADVPLIIENKALGYKISYFLNSFNYSETNTNYTGMPVFEEMQPEDSDQQEEWEENRLRTYCGSFRHFLTAISSNKKNEGNFRQVRVITDYVSEIIYEYDEEYQDDLHLSYSDTLYLVKHGFNVIHLMELKFQPSDSPFPSLLNTNRILYSGRNSSEYMLQFPRFLQIVYDREREEREYLESLGKYHKQPEKQVSAIALNSPSVTIDTKGQQSGENTIQKFGYWTFERLADLLPSEYEVPDSVIFSYDEY